MYLFTSSIYLMRADVKLFLCKTLHHNRARIMTLTFLLNHFISYSSNSQVIALDSGNKVCHPSQPNTNFIHYFVFMHIIHLILIISPRKTLRHNLGRIYDAYMYQLNCYSYQLNLMYDN